MPTGLKNSPDDASGLSSLHLAQSQPRKAINQSIQVVFVATNVPQRLPGMIVPAGASVSLRGHNGTSAGNSKAVYAAQYAESLGAAGTYTITPDTEITYPVDNLAHIWVMGTLGDGIIVSVRAGGIS